MKKLVLIPVLIAFVITSYSQVPHAFNYQAILRSADGNVKVNEAISMQVNIINESGDSEYFEIHNTQTNEFGVVNIIIGKGTTSGNLSLVDWANGPYFIDITVNGANLGASPILGVPYALYAASGTEGPVGPQGIQGEAGDTRWEEVTGGINYALGKVGIGTENPLAKVDIDGNLRVAGEISIIGMDGDSITLSSEDIASLIRRIEDLEAITFGNYTVTDIDGNTYKTVIIGNQVWMAENLKVTRYADGTPIPYIEDNSIWSGLDSTRKAYCWYNNASGSNSELYGALYNWPAAMNGAGSSNSVPSGIQGVCPDGWHLPSNREWAALEYFLGMSINDIGENQVVMRGTVQGNQLKEVFMPGSYNSLWGEADAATNETGFSARPGGIRQYDGVFQSLGVAGFWWSSYASWFMDWPPPYYGRVYRCLYKENGQIGQWWVHWRDGCSVRCIRD